MASSRPEDEGIDLSTNQELDQSIDKELDPGRDPGEDRGKDQDQDLSSAQAGVLLLTVFVVGLCTIAYELLIGTVSSYFLGDSIRQFSLTIGLTMTAMGLGTWLSRWLKGGLLPWFLLIEVALGVIGGLSVPLLYLSYSVGEHFQPTMLVLILAIGTLIGLEIPLLTRMLERHYSLRANISNVLSLDYFGALVATLLFPFVLLPFVGIFKGSLLIGLFNLLVAGVNLWIFRRELGLGSSVRLRGATILFVLLLVGFYHFSGELLKTWESSLYQDRVIYSERSRYQEIVLTKDREDFRLYLDGGLQFSTSDEHRYHELLAHLPMAMGAQVQRVLILGGGDGLLVRELLKYEGIEEIELVDLDPAITELAKEHPILRRINQDSLQSEKLVLHNLDGFKFLEEAQGSYDLILADLPDPKNSALARLYSKEFYQLVKKRLSRGGIFVTQATSPFFAKQAFWSIEASVKAAGFLWVAPYHGYVPSFGDWGFVMASPVRYRPEEARLKVPGRYLSQENLLYRFDFPPDLRTPAEPSGIDRPVVLEYYLKGWKKWQ